MKRPISITQLLIAHTGGILKQFRTARDSLVFLFTLACAYIFSYAVSLSLHIYSYTYIMVTGSVPSCAAASAITRHSKRETLTTTSCWTSRSVDQSIDFLHRGASFLAPRDGIMVYISSRTSREDEKSRRERGMIYFFSVHLQQRVSISHIVSITKQRNSSLPSNELRIEYNRKQRLEHKLIPCVMLYTPAAINHTRV